MTPSLVVDSSAFIDYLIGRAPASVAATVERAGTQLNVPALCDAEVVAGLRHVVRRGLITRARARDALEDYNALPLSHHEHTGLMARAFDLATFSAYDAIYVALAERLGASLLTTDLRLARAVAASQSLGVALA